VTHTHALFADKSQSILDNLVALLGQSSACLSIYFADATLASAFVARWCAGYQVETSGGVFQVREDEGMPRVGATPHRTP
jgi:REP element-mobilizing transposase RayT